MSSKNEIRCYDYVNYPYPKVRDVLCAATEDHLKKATQTAAARIEDVATQLKVNIGGFDIVTDVDVSVTDVSHKGTDTSPKTVIQFEWKAVNKPGLFPIMKAKLSLYPLTPTETQLDFEGNYDPPMGKLGDAIDSVVGHRVAEATVHRFVGDVTAYLRSALS